jgi:outer membrane protein TolC
MKSRTFTSAVLAPRRGHSRRSRVIRLLRGLAMGVAVAAWPVGANAQNAPEDSPSGIVRVDPTADEAILRNAAAQAAANPQSGGLPTGGALPAPGTPLTLDTVLRLVENNHPKLRGTDVERRIATAKRVEKQGAFDPVLSVTSDFLRFNSTSTRGKLSEGFQNQIQVDFLTRSGIKLFAASRYNIGNVKSPLSSTGDTGEYVVGIKVPLFRDFRVNEKSVGERQAFIGESQADVNFSSVRLDLFRKAANDYWDWVAAKRRLDVARNLLELAKIRAEAIRQRTVAGDLPPIDAVEADQEVQRRQGGLTKAERDFQKAQFKLSLSLWADGGTPAPLPGENSVPDPTLQPEPTAVPSAEVDAGMAFAFQRRPELQTIVLQRNSTQLELDLARNQRKPVVDLTFVPGRDTGPLGVGNTVKAGVSIEFPLRQRTADGRIAAAQLKLQKITLEETNQRQQISNEVFDAVSAINTTWERYQAARRELEFAIVLERGETQRFLLGDSTLFLVNQRERATAEARNKVIDTQAEYEQARALFRAATVQW